MKHWVHLKSDKEGPVKAKDVTWGENFSPKNDLNLRFAGLMTQRSVSCSISFSELAAGPETRNQFFRIQGQGFFKALCSLSRQDYMISQRLS